MKLPRGDQYNMAVQNPNLCFSDSDLKLSMVQTNNLGLPIPYSGGFTTTYKVRNGNFSWAVRCFTREVDHLQKRYQAIDEFIEKTNCDYLVEARYLKHGIQVDNEWSSIIKMHWIEGDLFNVHLGKIINKKEEIESVLEKFVNLTEKLRKNKIAHGDLQHGNIIIKNDKLFLIDYDGMFLPEITAVGTGEVGHPNYQHPKRSVDNFDGNLDNFSSLVIYLALRAISIKPELWKKYNNAENILFKKEDFSDPLNSELFFDLSQIEELHYLVNNLVHVCLSDFSKIPNLKDFIDDKSEGVKITINSPKQKQAENPNDFFGNLYKNKTTTCGGFQYKPTHTLTGPAVVNNRTGPTSTSSSNPPISSSSNLNGSWAGNNKVLIFWAIIVVLILIIWAYNSDNSTNYSNTTSNTNVVDTIPVNTSCSEGSVKDSTGNCITRTQDCQNTNGVNSYWDGSYCSCTNGTTWNKSKTKCVTQLAYCQGINGANAVYNESDNTCGCATGYELNSNGICALPPAPKSNYEICQDRLGIFATYNSVDNTCGCAADYYIGKVTNQCVGLIEARNQNCSVGYPGTSFLKVDPADNKNVCACESGSYWNKDRTACYSLSSYDKSCKSSYGQGSYSIISGDSAKCDCGYGYSWNPSQTTCVTTASINAVCERDVGRNSIYLGTISNGKYDCSSPY
ncbi:MAG: hypothetical protein WCP24_03215 [bacterium]